MKREDKENIHTRAMALAALQLSEFLKERVQTPGQKEQMLLHLRDVLSEVVTRLENRKQYIMKTASNGSLSHTSMKKFHQKRLQLEESGIDQKYERKLHKGGVNMFKIRTAEVLQYCVAKRKAAVAQSMLDAKESGTHHQNKSLNNSKKIGTKSLTEQAALTNETCSTEQLTESDKIDLLITRVIDAHLPKSFVQNVAAADNTDPQDNLVPQSSKSDTVDVNKETSLEIVKSISQAEIDILSAFTQGDHEKSLCNTLLYGSNIYDYRRRVKLALLNSRKKSTMRKSD